MPLLVVNPLRGEKGVFAGYRWGVGDFRLSIALSCSQKDYGDVSGDHVTHPIKENYLILS